MEKFKSRENLPKVGVYNLDSFKKEILKDSSYSLELKDNRFLPVEKGGVFKYFYYNDDLNEERGRENNKFIKKFFPYVNINNTIVALAKLEEAIHLGKDTFYLSFVSVDESFQGKGYATQLLEEIFIFAEKYHFSIQNSSYTKEGGEKLYCVVQRLREKYPDVDFQEDKVFLERMKRKEKK